MTDYCRIPPFRNYFCRWYEFCLDAHALRERGEGYWDCLNCDHVGDRQPIDPCEAERAAALLAEIYEIEPAEILELDRPVLLEKVAGRWVQRVHWEV